MAVRSLCQLLGVDAFLELFDDPALFPDVGMLGTKPQLDARGAPVSERVSSCSRLTAATGFGASADRLRVRALQDIGDAALEGDAALAIAIERFAERLQRHLRIVLRLQVGGRL